MMSRKKRQPHAPVDYWDSLADAMLALFLCVLLIVLLFVLYFVQLDQYSQHVDDAPGDRTETYTIYGTNDDESSGEEEEGDESPTGEQEDENEQNAAQAGGGGGGQGGDGRHDEERRQSRDYPNALGDEIEGEESERSAVLVKVVDGETLLTLSREHIEFELYDGKNRPMTLCDYYPERVEYATFETNKNGQFYLPEKVRKGDYMLRGISQVKGYDLAEDTYFSVDRYYDWDKPLEVNVRMFPLRSTIHIHLVDKQSGEAVAGGSFQVVAAENIITLDGTIRYHTGEVVDTVLLDGAGNGESRELYFGQYLLRQELVPDFYGVLQEEVKVELKDKTAVSKTLRAEKTAMVIKVRDALYDDVTVPGAEFTVSGGTSNGESVISDSAGQIVLTNLQKDTTYRLRQVAAAEDYRIDETELSFTVDGSGLINGKVREEMIVENRMTRVSFQVTGKLLGNHVSDVRMTLADQYGGIVEQWTTSGKDTLLTGLEPGAYKLMIGSDLDHPIDILISDEANVQEFRYSRWTMTDTMIVMVTIVVLGLGTLAAVMVWRRRKRPGGGAEK